MTGRLLSLTILAILALVAPVGAQPPPSLPEQIEGYRLLYVPAESLDAVLQRDRHGVFLPQDEFRKLAAAARANVEKLGTRPALVVVSGVEYAAKIDGEQLVVTATAKVDNSVPGWADLAFPVDGFSIEEVKLDDAPAAVARDGGNANLMHLFLQKPGTQQLKVVFSTPLVAVGSDQTAGFALLPSAAAEMKVSVPAKSFLQVDGQQLKRPAANDQPAEYAFALGGKPRVQLRMTGRQASERADALTLASTAFGVRVTPGDVAWSARTQLQVFGRPVNRLVCRVPRSLEITSVESTGLESWELADTPDDMSTTTLTLNYRQPVDGSRAIDFRGVVRAEPGQAWEVPQLQIDGVASHVGVVRVEFPPGVRVRPEKSDGVRQVTQQTLGEAAAPTTPGDQALLFQVWKPDFKLTFTTESKAREVQIGVTTLVDVNDLGLDLTTLATIETRFAPLFDALVSVPAGWQILGTKLDGQPVDHQVLPNEAGTQLIRIALNPPLAPGHSRTLQLSARLVPEKWPLEEGQQRLPLPDVKFPQAGLVEGLYGITAPAGLDIVPIELQGLDVARLADMNLLKQKLGGQGELRHGFTFQDATLAGQIETSRKPPRMAVSTRSFFRGAPDTLATHIEADLAIEGGGLRKLTLQLPESAGTDLRFALLCGAAENIQSTVQIIEQTSLPPADGLRTWTLRFDRFVTGPHVLSVDLRMPRTGDVFVAPQLRIAGAERENGYIVLEAQEDQFLVPQAVDASGRPLPVVDPVDVPASLVRPSERIVAAYFADRAGWQVGVKEQRFARTAVPTAIVHDAALSTVLSENGEWLHQADLQYSAVGIQAFQVRLPEAELWAAVIDNVPVEIRRQGEEYRVPLPAARDDAKHTLRLLYRSLVAPIAGSAGGRLTQTPPTIQIVDGAGATQPLEILRQTWTLYHPPELILTGSRGNFRPQSRLASAGLLESAWRLLTSPRPRDLGRAALIAAAIFGIAWLLRLSLSSAEKERQVDWRRLGVATACILVIGVLSLMLLPTSRVRPLSVANDSKATAGQAPAVDYFDVSDSMAETKAAPAPAPAAAVPPPMAAPAPAVGRDDADMRSYLEAESAKTQSEQQSRFGIGLRHDPAKRVPGSKSADDVFNAPQAGNSVQMGPQKGDGARPGPGEGGPSDGKPFGNTSELKEEIMRAKDSLGDRAGSGPQSGAGEAAPQNGQAPPEMPKPAEDSPPQMDREAIPPRTELALSGFSRDAGLLSLNTALIVPPGSRHETFEHRGEDGVAGVPAGASAEGPALDVGFRRVGTTNFRTWAVAAGLLLATWFLRGHRTVIAALLVLAIVAPLAAAPRLPANVQDLLDGLFFGGIAGVILLALLAVAGWICGQTRRWCGAPKAASALLLLAALLVSPAARADEPAQKPAADPTAVQDHDALVVPYGGDDPLTAFRVFLPQATYLKLYSQAHPDEAPKTPAPIESVISETLYSAALVPDAPTPTALVKGRFLVENFRESQVRVVLPIEGIALKSAALDGKSAPLLVENNRPVLLLTGTGRHVLDIEFEAAVDSTGPAGRLALKLHPTSAARLRFELPAPELEVRLNGATGLFRRSTTEGKTAIEAAVDRGGEIALAWQPKEMRGIDTALVQVETTLAAAFDDSGLLAGHSFQVRVRQGAISELRFSLPEKYSVRQIRGADVGGWQIEGDGKGTLKIFFRRAIDSETRLAIDLFQPASAENGEVALPELAPAEVDREVGQIGVFAPDQFGLRVGALDGVVQIDASKWAAAPEMTRPEGEPRLAYRFSSRPARLSVTPFRREPETVVTSQHGVFVSLRKELIASLFHYEFAGAPRGSISLELPPGYLPIDVEAGDALSDWYVGPAAANGTQVLTVEFTGPRTGTVQVSLQGRITRQPDVATASVQVPRPLELTRATATLAVWFEDVYAAAIREIPSTWKSIPADRVPGQLRQLQPRPVSFAFQATALELPAIPFDLVRNVPQLSGDSITLAAVSNTAVDYGLTLRWKIARAAADTFQFVTPAWLDGRLEFHDPQIRQVTSTKIDGGIRWTIQLNEPVRDQHLLSATATLPPAGDDLVQFPVIRLEPPTTAAIVTELESQRHFGILVNQSSRQLAPVKPADIHSVARQNLPFVLEDTLLQQAMEIVELPRDAQSPQWKSQRAEEVQGTLASVTGAEVITVFDPDGSWRTRVEYTIRSRGQQFLGLKMPPASRVLAAVVRDQPSRTVVTKLGAEEIHLLPLPETNVSDLSLRVSLIVAGQTGGRFSDTVQPRAQSFDIPAPHVLTRTESAEFGMTVAQTLWTVYVPRDFEAWPIVDAKRTNVMPEEQEDFSVSAELLGAQRQMADVLDLLRITSSDKYSGSQRLNAANNLKQVGVALQQYEGAAARYSGKNRERFDDFLAGNRALIDQAQQVGQAPVAVQNTTSPQGDAQQFIYENTLRLNSFNSGTAIVTNGTDPITVTATGGQPDATEGRFRFVVPESRDRKSGEKAEAQQESSRGRLRSQIANQSQADFSYKQAQPQAAAEPATPEGLVPGQSASGKKRMAQTKIPAGGPGGPMGGGMGGMGGGGFGSNMEPQLGLIVRQSQVVDGEVAAPGRPSSWSGAGGLSLRFELPQEGRALHFSKVGGGPKLSIAVRPQKTWETVGGWVWTAVWIGIAVWLVSLVRRPDGRQRVLDLAPLALALVGAACYLLIPGDGRTLGILIWVVVAVWFALSGRRRSSADGAASRWC